MSHFRTQEWFFSSWREDRIPDELSQWHRTVWEAALRFGRTPSEKSSLEHRPEKCCHKPGGRRGVEYIKGKWLPGRQLWEPDTALWLLCLLIQPDRFVLCPSSRPQPHLGFLLHWGLGLCLSLSLSFADRLHTLSEKSCHLEVYFSFFFFFKKKLMFSCQPGRQTACINLSHAKAPFKAAITCSGCLILWGQWEGPWSEAAFIHVKLESEDVSRHGKYLAPSMGKHFQPKYLDLLSPRFPTLKNSLWISGVPNSSHPAAQSGDTRPAKRTKELWLDGWIVQTDGSE